MLTYPQTPAPQYPLELSVQYKTIISQFEAGTEQRRRQWRFPQRSVSITYNSLDVGFDDVDSLWAFHKSVQGAFIPFNFFVTDDNPIKSYTDEYVGRGDGDTVAFNMPGATTSAQTIYVDGVESTDLTIGSGTGEGGGDLITFNAAPSSGALITCDFTGILRLKMRYAEDMFSLSLFRYNCYQGGVKLIEVKGA